MVLLMALVLIALVVSGPLAEAVGSDARAGLGRVTAYQIAKWPIMAAVVLVMLARALLRGAERQAAAHPVAEPRRRRRRS